MGVCLPGPGDKEALLFSLGIPTTTTCCLTALFLLASMWLLKTSVRDQERATNSKIGKYMYTTHLQLYLVCFSLFFFVL